MRQALAEGADLNEDREWGHHMRRLKSSPRLAVPVLVLAILAACEFPADEPSAAMSMPQPTSINSATTPEYVASLPPEQSRPAVNKLANEVVAAESAACKAQPDVDWVACMSSRMVIDFDRYGFLANHCRSKPDYKSLRDCALFGRSGVDWLLAIDGSPDTDFDWSQPQQSHDAALKKLNDALTKACEGKPEQPGNSCFTGESAKRLGLSETVATNCAARAQLEERGACIVDAHDAAMYQAALAAMARPTS
jgi:hypothetical protein